MNKITFNPQAIIARDLDGEPLPINIGRLFGNFINQSVNLFEWEPIARSIHAGQPVELDGPELGFLVQLVNNPGCPFTLIVRRPLLNHLEELQRLASTPPVLENSEQP